MPFSGVEEVLTPIEVEAQSEWRALVFHKAENGLVPLSALNERIEELSRQGYEERADALTCYHSSCRP